MKKENKPTQGKYADDASMNWLRVLEFGADVINANVNEQSRPANV